MKLRYSLSALAVALSSVASQAQTITFDTEDYAKVGVYDMWEDSPFRTGELTGNCAVIPNFLNQADENGALPDTTANILAVQRSRFGSNTFGARIDLKEPFELTSTTKYVQVLIYTPKQGRVMLIGLGKRRDRAGQSKEVVQFTQLPQNTVTAGKWCDAIFAVQGHGGIDIYSLVVVPDLESTHNLTADFAAYIDEIVVKDSPELRIKSANYPINIETSSVSTRSDRGILGVKLGDQSITVRSTTANGQPIYVEKLSDEFYANAGDTLAPGISYRGSWMSGYAYVDWGNDGDYSYEIDSITGKPVDGTDLVSYSFYQNKNSAGESVANGNTLALPTFVVPKDTKEGFYRMRYKVDWNSIDPGGNGGASNNIISNGGGYVDTRLNIHGDTVLVNDNQLNGEVLAADGSKLNNYKHAFGEPLTIKMNPENGFSYNGIRVRHGHNLGGDSLVHSTPQYIDVVFENYLFDENDQFTIPAKYVDGDMTIYGLIVEKGKENKYTDVTYNLVWGGDVKASGTKKLLVGTQAADSIPTFTNLPDFVVAGSCDSTIVSGQDTISVYAQWDGPFVISSSYADATWYNLLLSSSYYLTYASASSPNIEMSQTLNEGDVNQVWAFIGDPFNGLTIVNGGAGEKLILRTRSAKSDGNTGGSTYPVLSSLKTQGKYSLWTAKTSSYATDGFFLENEEGTALNYRAPHLAYWTGGRDAGSTFTISETDVKPTGIANIENGDANNAGAMYDITGRRIAIAPKHGVYIRNGKKYVVK